MPPSCIRVVSKVIKWHRGGSDTEFMEVINNKGEGI